MAASLGRKPGVEEIISVFPDASCLPGAGWRVLDERTWLTGIDNHADWARRAQELGSITAWRSFEDKRRQQWVWVQVVPLATATDAELALDAAPEKFLRNLRAKVTVVSEGDVDPPGVEGATRVWAHAQQTASRSGQGQALTLAFTADRHLGVVTWSSNVGQASWDDVTAVAAEICAQIARRSSMIEKNH